MILKIHNITQELASVRPFLQHKYISIHSQGNVKVHLLQKQAQIPLFLSFIQISYHKMNLYARNYKFNYTHTSLIHRDERIWGKPFI